MKNQIIYTKEFVKLININSGFSEFGLNEINSDFRKPGYIIISCQAALNGAGSAHCLAVISGINFDFVTLYNGTAAVENISLYIRIIYKKQ